MREAFSVSATTEDTMPRPAKTTAPQANELAEVAHLVNAAQEPFEKGDLVFLKHEKLFLRSPPEFDKPAVVTRLVKPNGELISDAMRWKDFAYLAKDPATGKYVEYIGDSCLFRRATPEELAAFDPPAGA